LVVYVVDENTHCRITTSQALLQMGLRRSAAINGKWTSSDVMAPTMLAGSHDDGTNVAVRVGRIVGRSKSGSVILHRYLIQDDAETDGDKCIREEIDVDKEPCLAPAWWHTDNKSKGTTTQSKTKASAARPRHFDISFKFVSSALYEAWLDHLPSESQVFSKPFALDGKGRLPHQIGELMTKLQNNPNQGGNKSIDLSFLPLSPMDANEWKVEHGPFVWQCDPKRAKVDASGSGSSNKVKWNRIHVDGSSTEIDEDLVVAGL